MYVYVCAYVCLWVYVCMCVRIYAWTYICIYLLFVHKLRLKRKLAKHRLHLEKIIAQITAAQTGQQSDVARN